MILILVLITIWISFFDNSKTRKYYTILNKINNRIHAKQIDYLFVTVLFFAYFMFFEIMLCPLVTYYSKGGGGAHN